MTTQFRSVVLSEDEVDDVLYAARVGDAKELLDSLAQMINRHALEPPDSGKVLVAAVDSETGNSALHYAAANGHKDIIRLIHSVFTDGTLQTARQMSQPEPRKTGHERPPPPQTLTSFVNFANAAGNTALHWAALNGYLDIVRVLVQLGADPALTNTAGHDAVFEAERNDKEEVVKWFLAEVPGLERAISRGEQHEDFDAPTEEQMDVDETKVDMEEASTVGPSKSGAINGATAGTPQEGG